MKNFDFFVYCDGSYNHQTTMAGYAFLIVDENDQEVYRYSQKSETTTSNRMEYSAFIESIYWMIKNLKDFKEKKVLIQTDSEILTKTYNVWMEGWHSRGWKKSNKKEPANIDLVKEIFNIKNNNSNIEVRWIKGHAGHKWNEIVDQMAQEVHSLDGEAE